MQTNNPQGTVQAHVGFVPQMKLTEHERSEWQRFATALYTREQNAIASEINVAACLGWAIPLSQFDRIASMYRAWLVFGEYPAAL